MLRVWNANVNKKRFERLAFIEYFILCDNLESRILTIQKYID